ncbi:MAG: UDP-N-acetylmuramoyl-L-alanine--D-glutamate ligase [Cytophagales bacterium]|nr:UDP-N-acetylmuramoyl-L-alanine--D-glutamate ligase [Armatimonadota bacterium]
MTNGHEFAGKRVAVIGLAATGVATARVLRDLGATVRVYDSRAEADLSPERVVEVRGLGDGVTLALDNARVDWERTDLMVPSPGVPRTAAPLAEAVRRKVPVLGEIEVAYRIARAPILAITGTNGKTTTTALLGAICRGAGIATSVAGNIAEDAGVRLPLIQAAVLAPPEGVIVAEISSFQLEWVSTFRPRVAAWLNLSSDHLDRYPDFEDYARAKARLFAFQTPADIAVLNRDDPGVTRYSQGAGKGQRWEFSVRDRVPIGTCLEHDLLVAAQGPVAVAHETKTVPLMPRSEIPLPGLHNVANVLAASAIALAFGIGRDVIRRAVRGFPGVAHRMELVATIGGVEYVNNSMCTNPAAVSASLEAVRDRPVVAIVGGKHKGGDLSEMIAALQDRTAHIVLIGASAGEIGAALDRESRRIGTGPVVEFAETLPGAVQRAARAARPGDRVMLVPGCASFDMFTGFEQRGQVFRDAVKRLPQLEQRPEESRINQ